MVTITAKVWDRSGQTIADCPALPGLGGSSEVGNFLFRGGRNRLSQAVPDV